MSLAPGWYPDPSGRYDHRYHNGRAWTADVAVDGERFVDPPPVARPAPTIGPPAGRPAGRNGLAVAGMVCGIVGAALAWLPLAAFVGLPTAVVGLILALVGLRRSRADGVGRSAAITGIVTGGVGIAASVVGIGLTIIVLRALDEFESPEPSEVEITSCTSDGRTAAADGSIVNLGDDDQTYTITVELASDGDRARDRVEIESLAPDDRRPFRAEVSLDGREPSCRIVAVRGPLPFGVDPGID